MPQCACAQAGDRWRKEEEEVEDKDECEEQGQKEEARQSEPRGVLGGGI